MSRNRILSPREVETLIAEHHIIVISEGRVLQLDRWLDKHPGGRLAVLHMVGRDATNEINIYHTTSTLKRFDAFQIGRVHLPWSNLTPPIRGGVFSKNGDTCNSDNISDDENTSGTGSDSESIASSNTSLGLHEDSVALHSVIKRRRTEPWPALDTSDIQPVQLGDERKASMRAELSKANYIQQVEQEEIDQDTNDYPSLDPATQLKINQKYQALHQRVKDEGFYNCHYTEYAKEMVRYTTIFCIFLFALRSGWYLTSAGFLGLFWHQIMFTAHDAGHRAITHNFVFDTLIGMFIADFCCGLSIGWWKSSHNVHHLITNHPEHDPDIQNVPLFATSPAFFKSLRSSYYDFTFVWDAAADVAVKYQKYTYYPVMGLARFNLYILSLHHLLMSPAKSNAVRWIRPTELSFIACYWFLFGYCLVWRTLPTWPIRMAFVLISHIITMPLHVQITLSHWGMSTADLGEGESFPQRQLRTTMDVDCPAWLDFIHGGLQFQAVHHLFPRVPRHNLRRLQVLVREFCQDTGIEYKILGFVDGNKHVLGRLGDLAKQVEILVKCQQYMAETGESGLH